ncbi:MAG: protein-disulfide reductase DsbD domain-containing protein [Pseudomonadota bacterium]
MALIGVPSINAFMKCFTSWFSAATLCAFPALSGGAFDDPVQAEVLAGWQRADGTRMAALRLTLDPGWKTYWRAPGDAGIPPHFDWSRARNIEALKIHWPTPDIFVSNGMRSIGYADEVVIPFEIQPARDDQPVRLRAHMSLGVCAEVCVPHQLKFDALLDGTETHPTPAIAAALASVPYSAKEAEVSASTCLLRPTPDGIEIEAHVDLPHTGGTEVAVIEAGRADLWISEADTKRQGNTVVAVSEMIQAQGGAFSIDRSDVRITIIGANYAVDVIGCGAG